MSTVATPTHFTPEDLLKMPDGERYELVDGQLVERPMSLISSYVAGRIERLLGSFCEANALGWVFPEGVTYQCFPTAPNQVRKADVSFISRERLTGDQAAQEGHSRIRPDLVVEVISPNDLFYQVDEKLEEYLEAGVPLIWVINPQRRSVRIIRANGTTSQLRETDEITGEEVIPHFRCTVREFFQLPPGVTPPTS